MKTLILSLLLSFGIGAGSAGFPSIAPPQCGDNCPFVR